MGAEPGPGPVFAPGSRARVGGRAVANAGNGADAGSGAATPTSARACGRATAGVAGLNSLRGAGRPRPCAAPTRPGFIAARPGFTAARPGFMAARPRSVTGGDELLGLAVALPDAEPAPRASPTKPRGRSVGGEISQSPRI